MHFGQTEAGGVIYTWWGLGPRMASKKNGSGFSRSARSGPHLSSWGYAHFHPAPSQAPSRTFPSSGAGRARALFSIRPLCFWHGPFPLSSPPFLQPSEAAHLPRIPPQNLRGGGSALVTPSQVTPTPRHLSVEFAGSCCPHQHLRADPGPPTSGRPVSPLPTLSLD